MGVLAYSSLMKSGTADTGVLADRADSSDGNVAVTGVFNCASLGLADGILAVILAKSIKNKKLNVYDVTGCVYPQRSSQANDSEVGEGRVAKEGRQQAALTK